METLPQTEPDVPLSIEVSPRFRQHVKMAALNANTTVRQLVTDAIAAKIGQPEPETADVR